MSRMSKELFASPKTMVLDDKLNVKGRIADMTTWLREWFVQEDLLRARIYTLDPDNPVDVQKGMQIAGLRRRLRMQLVKQPIELSPEAIQRLILGDFRTHLRDQYYSMTKLEKILWLNNFLFIMTPDLRELNQKIENVRGYGSLGQQRNFLLGGHSGMGKTTYLDWYTSNHIPVVGSDRNIVPIIKVDAPVNNNSAKPLFQRMILECGCSYGNRETDEELLMKLILFIQKCGVEMIIVDEIEHIERPNLRRRLLEISNLTRGTPIICASCEPLRWTDGDVEVQGRWNDYFELKQYTNDRLVALLAYIELLLPFTEPSHLSFLDLQTKKNVKIPGPARLIQEWTGGILRDVMILVADAAEIAIDQGLPCITSTVLEKAWRNIQSNQVTDFLKIMEKHEEALRGM